MITLTQYITESLITEARKTAHVTGETTFYTYKVTAKDDAPVLSSEYCDIDTSEILELHPYKHSYKHPYTEVVYHSYSSLGHNGAYKSFGWMLDKNDGEIEFLLTNKKFTDDDLKSNTLEIDETDGHIVNPVLLNGRPSAVKVFLSKEDAIKSKNNPELPKSALGFVKQLKQLKKKDEQKARKEYESVINKSYDKILDKVKKVSIADYINYVKYVSDKNIWSLFTKTHLRRSDQRFMGIGGSLRGGENSKALEMFASKKFWMDLAKEGKKVNVIIKPYYGGHYSERDETEYCVRHQINFDEKNNLIAHIDGMPGDTTSGKQITLQDWLEENE